MSNNKGFTLVELMVTIAIASILLVVGVPSLNTLYETTRTNQSIKKIETIIAYARNQALSYNRTVSLCPNSNNDCGANWKSGIQVFIPAQGDVQRVELRYIGPFQDKDLIQFDFNQLEFTPDGQIAFIVDGADDVDINTARLIYCPSNHSNKNSQALSINRGGSTQIVNARVHCNDNSISI